MSKQEDPKAAGQGVKSVPARRWFRSGALLVWLAVLLVAGWAHAAPMVTSITGPSSPAIQNEIVNITVTYDTAMDTSVAPVISFPTAGENALGSMSPTGASWLDAKTFQQSYLTNAVVTTMLSVDVAVAGARDTNGVVQVPAQQADVFGLMYIPPPSVIDMIGVLPPGDVVLRPGRNMITTADVGKVVQFFIRYDRATDYGGCGTTVHTSLCPNIIFQNVAGGALGSFTNVQSQWSSRTLYKVSWTIAEGGDEFSSVDALIPGGVGRRDDSNFKSVDKLLTGVFSIDTKRPTISTLVPSKGAIHPVDVGGNLVLTATFSEPMDTSVAPTMAGTVSGGAAVLTPTTGIWVDSTHFAQNFTIGSGAANTSVQVQVSGARDANGNQQNTATYPGLFTANPPAVTSITGPSSPAIQNQTVNLTVTYGRTMDTSVAPVISFPTSGENALNAMTPTGGAWLDASTFRQTYQTHASFVTMLNVDVAVSGARDTNGEVQLPAAQADLFGLTYATAPSVIDMTGSLLPGDISVSPAGTRMITTADVGKVVQFFIRYDQATDYAGCGTSALSSLCPNISFPGAAGGKLGSLTNVQAQWVSRTQYKVSWTIAEGGDELSSVNALIAGGAALQDDSNFKSADKLLAGVFSIDTKRPAVSMLAPSQSAIHPSDVGGNLVLTATFSKPMDTSVLPTMTTLAPGADALQTVTSGTFLTPTSGAWADSTHFVQNFTIGSGAVNASIPVQVSGARDAHGNQQNAASFPSLFAVNPPSPVDVPTLSPLALALLTVLLAGASMGVMRRRRTGSGS